ncbi:MULTISPECIES: hypothetical protein [unclassified Leucobacter]|uniref:hypothetical protein n=1 Tax=unclassified Leucobacter TaxID=2621730 RepID=UPI001BFD7C68|nr:MULTISPECIES: hypothetical protein [unclassified Leucobacter]
MLDPIKVTVMTPGLDVRGNYSERGIPAAILLRYLRFEERFNAKYPGFETLTHGMTEAQDGRPRTVICVKE